MTSERPILMSGPMVRAILDGRKTQTRRVVKMSSVKPSVWTSVGSSKVRALDHGLFQFKAGRFNTWSRPFRSPYGVPGDRLLVKASQLELEVKAVRVERLQEISEEGAKAEGVEPWVPGHGPIDVRREEPGMVMSASYRDGLEMTWNSLNAKRAPWESNPWVWAVRFAVIE